MGFIFDEFYLNNQKWDNFHPQHSILHSSNVTFIEKIVDITNNKISDIINSNKQTYKFVIFSIWDFPKPDLPKFHILSQTDDSLDMINNITHFFCKNVSLIEWMERLSTYKAYIKFIKTLNTERRNSGEKQVHFWDFLHSYKTFMYPMQFVRNKKFANNELVILDIKDHKIVPPMKCKNNLTWIWDAYEVAESIPDAEKLFWFLSENYYDKFRNKDEGFCIYEFPILTNIERFKNINWFRSCATISIGAKRALTKEIISEWSEIIFGDFQNIVTAILAKQYNRYAFSKSIQSSIATIMSRNGSHNIGSHVLAAVGNKYNDLPDDQILFKYIQHRMDYIAQISTEFPDWTSPTWFVRDLMRRFYMQRHLLKYISQADGLGAYEFQPKKGEVQNNKILIKIGKKNGKTTDFIISDKFQESDFKNDVQIAMPGGIIGHQAFYTIIENIIRNAAKHEWNLLPKDSKPENLEITIEIDDEKNRNFIIFRIYDNVSKPTDDINEKLTKSFVDQATGKLLKSNWGLAEMKISAGFLNGSSINQIGSDNKDDILFKLDNNKKDGYSGIIRTKQSEDGKLFGYEFAIPKPKEVLIIGMDNNGVNESLIQNNIYLADELTPDTELDYEFVVLYGDGKNDFINLLKDCENKSSEVKQEIERFPFRLFIVLDDHSELKPDKLDESGFLSNRIVILNKGDIKFRNAEEVSDFKLFLYKKWVRHLMKRRGVPKDKNLKMLIKLSGDHGHAKEDIVKLIFYRFKDSLLKQIKLKNGKEDIKEQLEIFNSSKDLLRNVTDSDIDGYKPYDDPYADSSDLINNWVELATNKYRNANEISDQLMTTIRTLQDALKKPAKIYLEVLKDMYIRYDEDCQTLPKNYRGENSTKTGDLEDLCIDDDSSIFITDDEKVNALDVAYNRHSPVKAGYYSEALSGSQIYFSLLQNLADESRYEKNKRILQLIENALLRVVIVDERVAQYYSNCNDQIRDRFVKGKFKIPTKITYRDKTLDLIKNPDKQDNFMAINKIDSSSYDVFIIHQGILDKIVEGSLLASFIDKIKESVPFVIITSGRGEPENIPENVKFLPFSNIESFVLSDFPEKYLLTQMGMKIITTGA